MGEMAEELSPERAQQIAAINDRTFAMREADREQWFRDHPVSGFAPAVDRETVTVTRAQLRRVLRDQGMTATGDGRADDVFDALCSGDGSD